MRAAGTAYTGETIIQKYIGRGRKDTVRRRSYSYNVANSILYNLYLYMKQKDCQVVDKCLNGYVVFSVVNWNKGHMNIKGRHSPGEGQHSPGRATMALEKA